MFNTHEDPAAHKYTSMNNILIINMSKIYYPDNATFSDYKPLNSNKSKRILVNDCLYSHICNIVYKNLGMKTNNLDLHKNDVIRKKFASIFDGSWHNCHKPNPVLNNKTSQIQSEIISDVNKTSKFGNPQNYQEFKLEIRSHTNIPVVGKGSYVEYTGITADVNAFSPKYET